MTRRFFVLAARRPRRRLAGGPSAGAASQAKAGGALPQVVVLATGGTIAGAAASDVQAGYASGQVGVEQLLAAVPQAKKLAVLRGEQISNIGSQDMNDEVWLKLARRINELVAMPNVAGVVITHGTDTIEETAYFLNLVVKSKKPVVLTASMRPSTALSADGPLNFYNAVAVAANKEAAGRGVLVVINDWIHGASSLTKTSTTAVQTFMSPLRGLIGTVAYGNAEFYRGPVGRNTVDSEFSLDGVTALPRVDIIMANENMDGALIDAAAAAGAKGIVIAGVGNGNLTAAAVKALAAQAKKGIVCVRSTRVATGLVGRNVELDDDKLGFVASLGLNPQKSRVLLRLALLKNRDLKDIQRIFDEYDAGGPVRAQIGEPMKAITVEPKKPGTARLEDVPSPTCATGRSSSKPSPSASAAPTSRSSRGSTAGRRRGKTRLVLGHESLGRVIDPGPTRRLQGRRPRRRHRPPARSRSRARTAPSASGTCAATASTPSAASRRSTASCPSAGGSSPSTP